MSQQQTLQTSESPHLVIQEIAGDLLLRPCAHNEVIVRGSPQNLIVNQTDEQVTILCTGDCAVYAPVKATVEVQSVNGDVSINGILGALSLAHIGGDLALRDVGAVTLDTVMGDLAIAHSQGAVNLQRANGDAALRHIAEWLRVGDIAGDARLHHVPGGAHIGHVGGDIDFEVSGAVTVESVDGDCEARRLSGDLTAGRIGGDLAAHFVQGSLHATVQGDVDLAVIGGNIHIESAGDGAVHGAIQPETRHRVQVDGELFYHIPRATNAVLHLESDAEIQITGLDGNPVTTSGSYELTLGTGSARLDLSAGKYLQVSLLDQEEAAGSEFTAEFEFGHEIGIRAAELTQQIASQIEGHMETLTKQMDERLAHLSNSEEIAARVQKQVQNAMRRAEEKMAQALKDMEAKSHRPERRRNRERRRERRHHHGWQSPQPPSPPQPPRPDTVGEEERMLILRMVEEGKISVDQAEQLLAALRQ